MSAKSLHRRWNHEIQIALLRRKQPWHEQFCQTHRCGQSGFSLVSLAEPCTTGDTSLLLTVGPPGPADHDLADSETDTAIPDDDIVSLMSYAHESV